MGQSQEGGDLRLVREFKGSRDRECFAAFFDRYARPLYAVALGMLHDVAGAEDCVQETFRRAIERVQRFDENKEDSDLLKWLFMIAKHVCMDEIRRTRTRDRHGAEAWTALQRRVELSPEEQAMLSELRDELSRLAPEYRHCYLLFHVHGYKYKEIMKITGYPYDRVKTDIQTAKRHIERRFR